MKTLKINENPSVTDNVLFTIKTTNKNNQAVDPYRLESIKIYFIERDFGDTDQKEYSFDITEGNSSYNSTFYYKDAIPVKVSGSRVGPAWFADQDESDNFVTKVSFDESGNATPGVFEYIWNPIGAREGDYFICWSWIVNAGDDLISDHQFFYLNPSKSSVSVIPTHNTIEGKYETLLERYTPEMFKVLIKDGDRSPDVLQKFNNSVAAGFTFIEDFANQIVDLLDSNAVKESTIQYLSNTLGSKLKSSDPTLWRRQIKEAVPVYKKKGTIKSLRESFSHAGMNLLGLRNFWQIISPFYFEQSFFYDGKRIFELGKRPLSDIKLKKMPKDENEYSIEIIDSKYSFDEEGNLVLSEDLNDLNVGDFLKIEFYYNLPKNTLEETMDYYIKNLPLADNRSEKNITKEGLVTPIIPIKNWNVRLVSEDDPMSNVLLSSRHPFTKNIVFGKIRTEFPYSENVYNMDEYNGSERDSLNPCDIDKNFLDPCSYCLSGKFDIDLEIDNLSDDRLLEAKDIITENTPFHSILKTINIHGGQNEFVIPQSENQDIIIEYKIEDFVLGGNTQNLFYRNRLMNDLRNREELVDKQLVLTTSLLFKNIKSILFSETINFNNLPISENCFLEIQSGVNFGLYNVKNPSKGYIEVEDVIEPLNPSQFNFKLYNNLYSFTAESLTRNDLVEVEDVSVSYKDLNLKTIDDSDPFKLKIEINNSNYLFEIKEILPNGNLLIKNNDNIISQNFNGKSYSIVNEIGEEIYLKDNIKISTCKITHKIRSEVKFLSELPDKILKNDNNYLNFELNGIKYNCKILGSKNDYVIIDSYNGSNVGSLNVDFIQLLINSAVGYFAHMGIKAVSSDNLENILGIVNGANSTLNKTISDNFKEEFSIIIKNNINDMEILGNYYFISEINSSEIYLSGPFENFGLSGVNIEVDIYKYKSKNFSIQEEYLGIPNTTLNEYGEEGVDRNNRELIEKEVESNSVSFLSNKPKSGVSLDVGQGESIFFEIKTLDGSEEKGEL